MSAPTSGLHALKPFKSQNGSASLKLLGLISLGLLGIVMLFNLSPEQFTALQTKPSTPRPLESIEIGPAVAPTDSRELAQAVLHSSDAIFAELMARGDMAYQKPQIAQFHGHINSPCSAPHKASGTFYCLRNETLYLDFDQLEKLQHDSPSAGAIAQAYLIVRPLSQHLISQAGYQARFDRAIKASGSATSRNEINLRLELLKDCATGLWFSYALERLDWLEGNQLSAGLKAAHAAAQQDRKQKSANIQQPGALSPDTQSRREQALMLGFKGGTPSNCTPFYP